MELLTRSALTSTRAAPSPLLLLAQIAGACGCHGAGLPVLPCLRGKEPQDALCYLLTALTAPQCPRVGTAPAVPPSLLPQIGAPSAEEAFGVTAACSFLHGDLLWLGCLGAWWCRGKAASEPCIGGKTLSFLLAPLLKRSPESASAAH